MTDSYHLETRRGPKTPDRFMMFEVYEESGSLLYVASFLDPDDIRPTDVVYRREWGTRELPQRRISPGCWEEF